MNTPAVRQATFADLDVLASLFDQYRCFQAQASDVAAAQAFLQARFERNESLVFLAEREGAAAGFAQLYPIFSSVAMARVFILNDLFVAAEHRRSGVASALLAAVEAHARAHGAVRVSLNVARDNLDGQALYAARGWLRDEQFFMYHRYPARD
jgi:GNAT superfamily N-acetyltransferase